MAKTLHISPTGSGTQDGSSWENAGTIDSLSSFITEAGSGGEVLIRADQGAYQLSTQVTITTGGKAGAPVTVRGVDGTGNAMKAQIVGIDSFEAFRLLTGANHLKFEDMSFSSFTGSAFRLGSDLQDITIERIDASDVTRLVQNDAFGESTTATVSGLTIRDSSVIGYTLGAISLKYDTNNVLVENFVGDGQNRTGEKYVSGIHLHSTAHDIVLRKVTMANNYGHASDGEYWNGDGFTTERGVYNVRFEDTIARNNTDGGYDIKSSNTVLVRASAEGNTHNFRFWTTSAVMENLTSVDATYYGGTGRATHV